MQAKLSGSLSSSREFPYTPASVIPVLTRCFSILGYIGLSIWVLIEGIKNLLNHEQHTDLLSLGRMGLGTQQDYSINLTATWTRLGQSAFYVTAVIANGIQLGASLIWYFSNSLLTSMFVSRSWALFIHKPQCLRVSTPRGKQKSSYFLSLPFRYSMPLSACSILLHWLLSQSWFVIQTRVYTSTGEEADDGFLRNPSLDSSVLGYSSIGIVLSLVTLVLFLIGLVTLGSRRLPYRRAHTVMNSEVIRMPLVSTCSAAIAAACHVHTADEDIHTSEIEWVQVEGVRWTFRPSIKNGPV